MKKEPWQFTHNANKGGNAQNHQRIASTSEVKQQELDNQEHIPDHLRPDRETNCRKQPDHEYAEEGYL